MQKYLQDINLFDLIVFYVLFYFFNVIAIDSEGQ